MKNTFAYEIIKRKDDYRFEIVSNGSCGLFFPVSYSDYRSFGDKESEAGSKKVACYVDTWGYSSLSAFVEIPSFVVINIMELLAVEMIKAMDYYMLPWDYSTTKESVYTNRKADSVKMIYKPKEENIDLQKCNISYIPEVLLALTKELIPQITEAEKDRIDLLEEILKKECYGGDEIIREIRKCKNLALSKLLI